MATFRQAVAKAQVGDFLVNAPLKLKVVRQAKGLVFPSVPIPPAAFGPGNTDWQTKYREEAVKTRP